MEGENQGLELILIEDSHTDIELFLNVVEWIDMGDQVRVFPDGREALDYLLGRGAYQNQAPQSPGLRSSPSSGLIRAQRSTRW